MQNILFLDKFVSSMKKGTNTVTTHNAMSTQNLFALKQYRYLNLCSSPIPFVQCWLQHYSWPCIIHHAAYKYWLPVTGSEVVTHWGWTQMQSHPQGTQENVSDNGFWSCAEFYSTRWNSTPANCVFFWIFEVINTAFLEYDLLQQWLPLCLRYTTHAGRRGEDLLGR